MVGYLAILVVLLDYVRLEAFVPALQVPVFLPLAVLLLSLSTKGEVSYKEVSGLANTRWLLFYLFLIVLSVITANVTLYAFTFFKGVSIYVIIYIILAREVDSHKKVKTFILLIVLGHLLLAVLNPDIILHPEKRSFLQKTAPFLGDGNDFAWSVLTYMPLSMFLVVDARRRFEKVMYGIFTVLLLFCIVGSSSRGAALGAMAAFAYLWVKSEKKLVGLALIAVLIVGVVLFAPPEYTSRIESVTDYENDGSAQGRLMAWGSAIRMAIDHPLLGVGAGHFPVAFGVNYRPEGVGRTEVAWLNAHSVYFKTLGELGFPGIIFLVGTLVSNIIANGKASKRFLVDKSEAAQSSRRLCLFLNASLIGWAVDGAFLSGIKYPHLFMLCALSSFLRVRELRARGEEGQSAQHTETGSLRSADVG